MRTRLALGVLAVAVLTFASSRQAQAQWVEVPTFLAGTPTFASHLQEVDVAVGSDGNFAIVWGEIGDQPGAASRVVARSFSRAGIALGTPNRVDTSGGAFWPELTAGDSGGYVVGWKYTPDGVGGWLYSRRLDAQARGVASEVRVDTPISGPVVEHDLAFLPSGPVYLWKQNGFWFRRYDTLGQPLESAVRIGANFPGFHAAVAALPDGGFVVVWADTWQAQYSQARTYFADGTARTAAFAIDATGLVDRVAVAPDGDIVAVGGTTGDVWMRRFRADATFVGPRQVVRALPATTYVEADAAFDSRGNLLVVWTEYDSTTSTRRAPRMRAYDAAGFALGPDTPIDSMPAGAVRTARLADDCFVNAWYSHSRAYGNVVCLCSSGNEGCGDGNLVDGDGCDSNCTRTRCGNRVVTSPETCDDGNSIDGDGCDSNCTVTGCGNGIVTAGEECDDANLASGDGCDARCLKETCGNGRIEGHEQCDDGNTAGGDGCEADCRLPESHDSVIFALDPIDISMPRGSETTTRVLVLQVQNADVLPVRESPGHLMRLTGSDGDCPPGTISDPPDFESGVGGVQDTVRVDGGLPATAHARITVSRKTFAPLDRRVPQRCTLWFKVSAVPEDLYDPTPDNNVVAVELNVYDTDAALGPHEDEVFIHSQRPTTVKIPRGRDSVIRQVKPMVSRAGKKDLENAGLDIMVTAGDGDCPKGTIGIADFDRRTAGAQNGLRLRRGKRVRGVLALVVRADAFTTPSDESPRRCTALLTISPERDTDPSNDTTRIVIDVLDRNDY